MKRILSLIIVSHFIFTTLQIQAQADIKAYDVDTTEISHHDLAQAAANPIANMISLPMQFNFNFGIGDYNRESTNLQLQPVIPFRLTDKWNVINRIIIPLIQKPHDAETGSDYGIGNINYFMFFVPPALGKGKAKFMYGFGPVFNIPTSSAPEFGGPAFGLGPGIVALMMSKHWVFGVTASEMWSYNNAQQDLNSFFGQYFIVWNIKKGWFVNSAPTITANFNAEAGEQWTVPVGIGGGRIIKTKTIPMKLMVQAYDNVVKPTGAADWTLTFMCVLMFP
ncbi:MAG: hypothetical protein KAR19_16825 [Bacteroidales bacterium]|nr:hypothetical protein [Bacteroidales bacterium]